MDATKINSITLNVKGQNVKITDSNNNGVFDSADTISILAKQIKLPGQKNITSPNNDSNSVFIEDVRKQLPNVSNKTLSNTAPDNTKNKKPWFLEDIKPQAPQSDNKNYKTTYQDTERQVQAYKKAQKEQELAKIKANVEASEHVKKFTPDQLATKSAAERAKKSVTTTSQLTKTKGPILFSGVTKSITPVENNESKKPVTDNAPKLSPTTPMVPKDDTQKVIMLPSNPIIETNQIKQEVLDKNNATLADPSTLTTGNSVEPLLTSQIVVSSPAVTPAEKEALDNKIGKAIGNAIKLGTANYIQQPINTACIVENEGGNTTIESPQFSSIIKDSQKETEQAFIAKLSEVPILETLTPEEKYEQAIQYEQAETNSLLGDNSPEVSAVLNLIAKNTEKAKLEAKIAGLEKRLKDQNIEQGEERIIKQNIELAKTDLLIFTMGN